MPEGPLNFPRLTNIGPLSRATREEIKKNWNECPKEGKRRTICRTIKRITILSLEKQGLFPGCDTLEDINSGRCFDIASAVDNQLMVKGIDVVKVQTIGGDHQWIKYKGVHYDAEAPTGVNDPFDLPFFQRIPPMQVLEHAQLEAEQRGLEVPQTPEEMIVEVEDD